MKEKKYIAIILLFAVSILSYCGRGGDKASTSFTEVKFKVQTVTVKEELVVKSLSFSGIVEAYKKENITPKITGKIKRIYVEEGDKVKKGQLLAELDTEQAEIQFKQAEGALEAAQANFEDAKKNYERGKKLLKEDAISKQQFEKLELAYKAAEGQLKQAKAALELAKFMINSSRLYAPFSGIVTSKLKEEGDFINPGMGGFGSGAGVLVLMNFEKIKVYTDVPSSVVHLIKKGIPAEIKWKEGIIPGKVFSIAQAADPASKTFKVGILAENRNLALKPGTDVDVRIIYQSKKALAVPSNAILEGNYVFVIENGIAHKRNIKTGLQGDTMTEILGGLSAGEKVIVGNIFGLYDGAKVEEEK